MSDGYFAVYVKWEDSAVPEAGLGGWIRLREVLEDHAEPVLVESVGWLLEENDLCIVICESVGSDHDDPPHVVAGAVTIPKAAIRSRSWLA